MNIVKTFTGINLWLNQIDVVEFVTLNDVPNKACAANKTQDLNISVFNMITGINKSETLTKDILYEF